MYERCKYYMVDGKMPHGYHMYTNATEPKREKYVGDKWVSSGSSTPGPRAVFLGSKGIENPGNDLCRSQAHVANSPQIFEIKGNSVAVSPPVDTHGKLSYCKSGDLDGYWKSIPDLEKCPSSSIDDARAVFISGNISRLETLAFPAGQCTLLYDSKSQNYLFEVIDPVTKAAVYTWQTPAQWPKDSYGDRQIHPPFQYNPKCSLGLQAIPSEYEHDVITYSHSVKLTGYEWVTEDKSCQYRHFTKGEMRRCIYNSNWNTIYMGGDSIMGGIAAMLKFQIGAHMKKSGWYTGMYKDMLRHDVSTSVAYMENGRNITVRSYPPKAPHIDIRDAVVIINLFVVHQLWQATLVEFATFAKEQNDILGLKKKSGLANNNTRIIIVGPNNIPGYHQV